MRNYLFGASFLFLTGCSILPQEIQDDYVQIEKNEIYQDYQEEHSDKKIDKEFLNSDDQNLYPVLYVFDGDTFETMINGKKEKIRILGIDTPEVDGGFRTADCYGDDASKYAKEYLKGKSIALLIAKKGDSEDKYGRLLRYVFVDGQDFGAHLIEKGYAESYKKFAHDRRSYYTQLEKTAQSRKVGMWNSDNCSFWGQEN